MSIDPDKPSRFAPLADAYKLSDADADRLLANIEARFAQESDAAESSSPRAGASAGSTGGKNVLLLGASCVALAIGTALVLHAISETPAVGPVAMARRPASAEPNEPARAPESAAATPSVSVDDLPVAAASPATSAKAAAKNTKPAPAVMSTSTTVAAPASNETLERETRLLGDARQALKVGDGEKALAFLDEHARLFPNGWLANDRAAERIVVLCSLGRRAEATREAAAFLDGRPRSPLTHRVETSCAGQSVTESGK